MTDRERVLYDLGCSGLPLGEQFFKEFPDSQEILPLALSLAVRRLVTILCNKDAADKDFLPAARLIFLLNGKDVGNIEEAAAFGNLERTSEELRQALERTKQSA